MRKRSTMYTLSYLTLIQQVMRELVQVFQTDLEDVEIVIDGCRVLDSAQFEQFATVYQATSLVARGYSREMGEKNTRDQSERPFVELKMGKAGATLLLHGWHDAEKTDPTVSVHIRKVLLRCQNRVHQWLIFYTSLALFCLFLPFQLVAEQHHLDFAAQLLFEVGGGISLGAATFVLFAAIVRLLKLETRVFLFPGARESTRTHGNREVIGTMLVALILLMLVTATLFTAFHIFWR
ncbi:MAG: hypothetical protein ACRDFB_07470 [Rhabdochlamydiaceae bacterium]